MEPLFQAFKLRSTSGAVAASRRAPGCLAAGPRGGGRSPCRLSRPCLDSSRCSGLSASFLASVTEGFLRLERLEWTGQGSHQSGYLGLPRPGDSRQGIEPRRRDESRAPECPFCLVLPSPGDKCHPSLRSHCHFCFGPGGQAVCAGQRDTGPGPAHLRIYSGVRMKIGSPQTCFVWPVQFWGFVLF